MSFKSFLAGSITALVVVSLFPGRCLIKVTTRCPTPANKPTPTSVEPNAIQCTYLGASALELVGPLKNAIWMDCDFPNAPKQNVLAATPFHEQIIVVTPTGEPVSTAGIVTEEKRCLRPEGDHGNVPYEMIGYDLE